jgi:hypothetical protein
MFCVFVGSVIKGWLKLANRTGSIAEVRASDRASRAGITCFDDVGSDGMIHPRFGDRKFAHWNGALGVLLQVSSLTFLALAQSV